MANGIGSTNAINNFPGLRLEQPFHPSLTQTWLYFFAGADEKKTCQSLRVENAKCTLISNLRPCPILIDEGETLSYECLYAKRGNSKRKGTLTCLPNGSLSGQPPVCVSDSDSTYKLTLLLVYG